VLALTLLAALWRSSAQVARPSRGAALLSTRGQWLLLLLLAVLLSFGPTLRSLGQPFMSGPYLLLYEHVPGYDGAARAGALGDDREPLSRAAGRRGGGRAAGARAPRRRPAARLRRAVPGGRPPPRRCS
jgi:hypothetical protein